MLKEVGFQAGQHEVIAEAFSKEIARNVSKQVKELREDRRKNKRVSEKLVNDLNSAYSEMTKSKDLFRKSFEEQERAIQAFKKADADGNVSRNDVERMRLTASTKTGMYLIFFSSFLIFVPKTKFYATFFPNRDIGIRNEPSKMVIMNILADSF